MLRDLFQRPMFGRDDIQAIFQPLSHVNYLLNIIALMLSRLMIIRLTSN